MWNVYLLETKMGGSVKQFNLSILILFLFYACGGGGGDGGTGKTAFTPASNAPTPLYYFCTSHSGMGGTANISGTSGGSGYSIPSKVEPIDTQ